MTIAELVRGSFALLIPMIVLSHGICRAQTRETTRPFERMSVGATIATTGLHTGRRDVDKPDSFHMPAAADVAFTVDIPVSRYGSLRAERGRATWDVTHEESGLPREDALTQRRLLFTYVHAPWRSLTPIVPYIGVGGGLYSYDGREGLVEIVRRHGPHFQVGVMVPRGRSRISFDGGFRVQFMGSPNAGVGEPGYQPGPRDRPITAVLLVNPSAFVGARLHL